MVMRMDPNVKNVMKIDRLKLYFRPEKRFTMIADARRKVRSSFTLFRANW